MARCDYCGKEVALPYRCKYCGGTFCVEHHLPEEHNCPGLSKAVSPSVLEKEAVGRGEEPRYTVRVTPYPVKRLFYPGEVKELLIAFLAVFLVFAYPWALTLRGALTVFLATLTAFLFHELSHKFTAQNLGYSARFTISPIGLLLTFISSLMPIKIVMPGYVAIYAPYYSKRDNGIIAAAGPFSNILVCVVTLFLSSSPLSKIVLHLNALVAFFNLIPLGELDGRKILAWNPALWAVMMGVSIALYFLL